MIHYITMKILDFSLCLNNKALRRLHSQGKSRWQKGRHILPDWSKGGIFGGLRARSAKAVRDHLKANATLRQNRRPLSMRVLSACLGDMGVFGFLIPYAVIAAVAPFIEAAVAPPGGCILCALTAASHQEVSPDIINGYILAAQAVLIGLLFPIVVGLVSIFMQSRDASGTANVEIYYSESLARKVAASGISLIIVLAFQLLWPIHVAANRFGLDISGDPTKEALTIIHVFWLIFNLAAMWHFLTTSLDFILSNRRAKLRKQFAANVAIPDDLRERIDTQLYQQQWPSELAKRCVEAHPGSELSIYCGAQAFNLGDIEVATPGDAGKTLVDIRMALLAWAIERWQKRRVRNAAAPDENKAGATLLFPPLLGEALPEGGVICRRLHAPPFDRLERRLIQWSFVFRGQG